MWSVITSATVVLSAVFVAGVAFGAVAEGTSTTMAEALVHIHRHASSPTDTDAVADTVDRHRIAGHSGRSCSCLGA